MRNPRRCSSGRKAQNWRRRATTVPRSRSEAKIRTTNGPRPTREGEKPLDLLDALHLRQEMLEQVLDAVLQRRGRGGAAGAGAFHREIDDPVAKTLEGDVAAVARHRWAHARFDQF